MPSTLDLYAPLPVDPRLAGDLQREPPQPSIIGAFARHALRSAAPTAGGIATFGVGAELGGGFGTAIMPGPGTAIGAVGGGLITSVLGASAAEKAQNWLLDQLDPELVKSLGQDRQTLASDEQAHPWASFAGSLAPQAAFLRPGFVGVRAAAGGAAIAGGVEAGTEYEDQAKVDPFRVMAQAAAGAALHKPTRLGDAVQGPGARMAATIAQGHGLTLPMQAADETLATMPPDRPAEEMTADQAAAAHVKEDGEFVAKSNPFHDDIAGATGHGARLAEATRAAAAGRPADFRTLTPPQTSYEAAKARIAHFESGNSYTPPPNPSSSATGKYQFTDPTWLGKDGKGGFAREVFPGKSDAELRALKTDPSAQERVMDHALASYSRQLRAAGVETTPGNLYLMHFLGSDAVKVLHADPSAPIESILTGRAAHAIEANPTILKGKTAGDVVAEMNRRMGGDRTALHVEQSDPAPPAEDAIAEAAPEMAAPVLRDRAAPIEIAEKTAGSFQRGPEDLLTWIARRGGLRDDEGHGLIEHMGLQTRVAGVGDLIREGGMTIDQAREGAAEAGFFHNLGSDEALASTSEADFIDLLAQAKERPHYAVSDLNAVAERDDAARAREGNRRFEQHANGELDAAVQDWRDSGFPAELSPHERKWALAQMAQGADAHSAIEHTWSTPAEEIAAVYGVKPEKVRRAPPADDGEDPFAAPARSGGAPTPEALKGYDAPGGDGARAQAESVLHDLAMAAERDPDGQYRIEEDGDMRTIGDWLADMQEERRSIDEVRACAAPKPMGGETA